MYSRSSIARDTPRCCSAIPAQSVAWSTAGRVHPSGSQEKLPLTAPAEQDLAKLYLRRPYRINSSRSGNLKFVSDPLNCQFQKLRNVLSRCRKIMQDICALMSSSNSSVSPLTFRALYRIPQVLLRSSGKFAKLSMKTSHFRKPCSHSCNSVSTSHRGQMSQLSRPSQTQPSADCSHPAYTKKSR